MAISLLGVRIDEYSKREALDKASDFLFSNTFHYIVTPNPEMLVKARRDVYFQSVLNKADLAICDGTGIQLFAPRTLERIPGVDFALELCGYAAEHDKTVYLVGGGSDRVVSEAAKALVRMYPQLKVVGWHKGPMVREVHIESGAVEQWGIEVADTENQEVLKDMAQKNPDLVLVAFGMGKQEKWMVEYVSQVLGVKVAIGVGGMFDYVSGMIPRAPEWLRRIGGEWVYRLVQQPKRLWRIVNATIVFPVLVLTSRFLKK